MMSQHERQLREALTQIAEVASGVLDPRVSPHDDNGADRESPSPENMLVCTPKSVPPRLLVKAAQVAMEINPVNAPAAAPAAGLTDGFHVSDPLQIAVVTQKYWGPRPRRFTVSFMESTPADLRARIISHMNAW